MLINELASRGRRIPVLPVNRDAVKKISHGAVNAPWPVQRGSLEGYALKVPAACGTRRGSHPVPVVDLPAFEFVQQGFVADIQAPGGLLAIPTGLLEDPKHQFLFSSLCGTRRDILQRHV